MRPPFWATVLTIISMAILCALGAWQLQRLEWKTGIIEKITAEYKTDPWSRDLTSLNFEDENLEFSRGFISGTYLPEGEMLLSPRTREGQTGYNVIVPFKAIDSEKTRVILVNRGWLPSDKPPHAPPAGEGKIAAMLRKPESNLFTPSNDPASDKWYKLDLKQIAETKNLPGLAPYILQLEKEDFSSQEQKPAYPLAETKKIFPASNHVSYAFFWFSMAAALLLIYILRFFRGCTSRS